MGNHQDLSKKFIPEHLQLMRSIAELNAFNWMPVDKFGFPNRQYGNLLVTIAHEQIRIVCTAITKEDGGVLVDVPSEATDLKDKEFKIIAWMPAPAAYNNVNLVPAEKRQDDEDDFVK